MTEVLNTPHTLSSAVGELEQTANRLAEELNITVAETPASGISYEKEFSGENEGYLLSYFKDLHDHYEVIEVEQEGNQFKISNCEGKYSIILRNSGKKLLDARKPYKQGIESKLHTAIVLDLAKLGKSPETQHEICIGIEKSELQTVSKDVIKKYL